MGCLRKWVRSLDQSGTTLDLMYASRPDTVTTPATVPGISDHVAVVAECEIRPTTSRKQPRTVYVFKKENKEGMEKDMSDLRTKYEEACDTNDVKTNWNMIKDGILAVIRKKLPTKTVYQGRDLPWFNHSNLGLHRGVIYTGETC